MSFIEFLLIWWVLSILLLLLTLWVGFIILAQDVGMSVYTRILEDTIYSILGHYLVTLNRFEISKSINPSNRGQHS